MATSAKQLAANRANAKKSTGPRTELGKRISRMNSTTHGLCGHTVLKTPEDDAAYRTYYHRLMPDLSPANAVEQDFAERIIYDSWRIHRASAIESNIFALAEAAFDTGNAAQDDALNDAHAFQVNDRAISLLSLYQQRLQRGMLKDLAALKAMQKERLAQPVTPRAASAPAPYPLEMPDPTPRTGFVDPIPEFDPEDHPPVDENRSSDMAA